MSAIPTPPPADPQRDTPVAAREPRRRWFQPSTLGFWVLAILIAGIMLMPIYVLVMVSLSTLSQATSPTPAYINLEPTLDNWRRLLDWNILSEPLTNSVVVASVTGVLAVLLAAPAAYVIARLPAGPRYFIVLGVLFTRMFPEVIIATPIASTFFGWGLNDTNFGLILAHLIRSLPLATWILVGTFQVIPSVLEEASHVDGNSRIGTLWRVVIPLSLPGIIVAGIFAWLDSWNDLLYAIYLFLTSETLPLVTYYYANRGQPTDVATFSVILAVPVVILTIFLQRWIRSGYLSGAVKG